MNQTLVIGSAVVDVIVRVEHLPKCGEDVHVSPPENGSVC